MSRSVKNAWGISALVCFLALILFISPIVRAQHKPIATWVDVDFDRETALKEDSKAVSKDGAKAVNAVAIKPEKQKSIWQEPAWYVAIAGSALDIAGSLTAIDGKRVREANSLFSTADGKLSLARALPVTVAGLYLQYRFYKNPKHRKWAIASMLAAGILHGTLGGARAFAMR